MAITAALMYARISSAASTGVGLYKKARIGATRLNYHGPKLLLWVDGDMRTSSFDRETWSVSARGLGQATQLTIDLFGFTPTTGLEIVLGAGSLSNRLFRGTIVRVQQVRTRLHEGRIVWRCTCLDWHYQAANTKITKKYVGYTPQQIIDDWVANFLPAGFTATHVQALAALDEIQFTMVSPPSALEQLADRIGGYGYIDFDKGIHLFTSEANESPEVLTSSNPHVRHLRHDTDIEGVRNQILVEGDGTSVEAPVAAGSTTIPVEDAVAFETSGTNYAKLEAQLISYTGKAGTDGAGSVVTGKTTNVPSAPSPAAGSEAGNLAGRYRYKVTFLINGGETAPSAASSEVTVDVAPPSAAGLDLTNTTGGSIPDGTVVRYKVTFYNAAGETIAGVESDTIEVDAGGAVALADIPTGPAGTTGRRIYRSDDGAEFKRISSTTRGNIENNNVDTTWVDLYSSFFGGAPPKTNTAGGQKVTVSSIPTGPAGTTARRLYRNETDGALYKRVTTIEDNSTTSYTDNLADSGLGSNAPDVSTVPAQPADTTLHVKDLAQFPASGWVRAGSQVVRYTGRSASSGEGTLTGIPAAGVGALTAAVSAGATLTVVPHLTGVPASGAYAIAHTLRVGEAIHILVLAADATSQSAYGLRQEFVQDRRLSLDGCAERAAAVLALLKDQRTTGTATSTDPKVRVGKPWVFNVTEWGLTGTVTVQSVTIRPLATRDGAIWPQPVREVQFSTRSIDDLFSELRAVRERLAQ